MLTPRLLCSYADCARELLEAGASPLPANAQGVSPLHYAAARGHSACMHLLLTATVQLPGGDGCDAASAQVQQRRTLQARSRQAGKASLRAGSPAGMLPSGQPFQLMV